MKNVTDYKLVYSDKSINKLFSISSVVKVYDFDLVLRLILRKRYHPYPLPTDSSIRLPKTQVNPNTSKRDPAMEYTTDKLDEPLLQFHLPDLKAAPKSTTTVWAVITFIRPL